MTRAIEMNGVYETMHGVAGENGCTRFGEDKMVLCVPCWLDASALVRTMQNDYLVKLSRPFKVWFWHASVRPCEACGHVA